jgi:HEPN domain-containing protein
LNLVEVAASYLRQAEPRLKDAKDAMEEGRLPYALRLSQECLELSLKASLKLVGIEYPKKHDVSEVLLRVGTRFPDWFASAVPALAEASLALAERRAISMYGTRSGGFLLRQSYHERRLPRHGNGLARPSRRAAAFLRRPHPPGPRSHRCELTVGVTPANRFLPPRQSAVEDSVHARW